ncbi:MAG TPA: N-acetyltransferase [Deltaproteobacteria bacterium]|jgi:amino-acid N-acetyltransferase|nr:N-acetyltransferase [Deltaproteobacteria bacterium]HON61049.1 N-acetyltransferase [Deltaproteobacteria bacterium]HRR22600.1 N-acetyltransferase [Desulfomonilia bacterium]HRR68462.1 N-acetyltransferase [Desulfomonilia bacterium]HRT44706.1 N-acetyltransferase [Desulfomonilia bacterium]
MIRKLLVSEVSEIKKLIDPFVKQGLMLPKSLHALYTGVRDFWIATDDRDQREIIGCCALQVSWMDLAEIRTLAVKKEHQSGGIGRELVEACISEAADLHLKTLFTLTYVPDFFKKMGFHEIDKTTLPNKIWADCIHCQYFPDCRETALIYQIGG